MGGLCGEIACVSMKKYHIIIRYKEKYSFALPKTGAEGGTWSCGEELAFRVDGELAVGCVLTLIVGVGISILRGLSIGRT
jgi:hypothetical protein